MERKQTFEFNDDELDTLESALALYAAYTREMEVNMLMGDESDSEAVMANHNRAKSMHRKFFDLTNERRYEEVRARFEDMTGRPMDLSDFSDFDWREFVQGALDEYDKYRVNYFEDGERIEKVIEGNSMRTTNDASAYIIERDGEVVWSHDLISTNTVELIE